MQSNRNVTVFESLDFVCVVQSEDGEELHAGEYFWGPPPSNIVNDDDDFGLTCINIVLLYVCLYFRTGLCFLPFSVVKVVTFFGDVTYFIQLWHALA